MKLSTLVYEVVLLSLLSSSFAADSDKNDAASTSQAARPAAQTAPATPASPATPATPASPATPATPATPVNPAAGQTASPTARPVTAGSTSTGYSSNLLGSSSGSSTKRIELDISKRASTSDYTYVASLVNSNSSFSAQYGVLFSKVKDGDILVWEGKARDYCLFVDLTADYRVTLTLQNNKKLMFQKSYKRWVEYDPKQVEVANYVDASGFSMGWEVHEAPAEPGKKEGDEDTKEGSKSGKSGRKVPVWGISLMAVSGTVLVVSIGVAIGIRMRK